MIPSLIRRLPYIQGRASLSASVNLLPSSETFSSQQELTRKNARKATIMSSASSKVYCTQCKYSTCQKAHKTNLYNINRFDENSTKRLKSANILTCTRFVSSSSSSSCCSAPAAVAEAIAKPTIFTTITTTTSDIHVNEDNNANTDTAEESKPAELMFYESFEIDEESDVDWQLLCEAHRKHGVWLTVPPQTPPKLDHVGPPVIPETIFSTRQRKRLRKMKLAYSPTHNPPPLHTTGTRTLNVNDLYESIGQSNSPKMKTNSNNKRGSSQDGNNGSAMHRKDGSSDMKNQKKSKAKMKTYTSMVDGYDDIYNFNYDDDDDDDDVKTKDINLEKQEKSEEKKGAENNEGAKETKSDLERNSATEEEKTLSSSSSSSSSSNELLANKKSQTDTKINGKGNINKPEEDKEKKRKERARLLKAKMYDNAPLELPSEENVEELLFAIWDGVALKRSDIVKPTGLPEEVYTLNASFAANESDLLLSTDNNDDNGENKMEREEEGGGESIDIERVIEAKHKKHRMEAERIRQAKFGNLHLDSKNGEFFIPALMIVEGKADRRDEELSKKLNGASGNGENSKEASRATPLGAAPGVKRTSTLSYLQYAGMKAPRDMTTNNNINNSDEDYDGQSSLQLLLSLIGGPTRLSLPSQQYKETLTNETANSESSTSSSIVDNKLKVSKAPLSANSFSTYFIFSSIREASKRFANPFGDSPNAIILEEKKEPINPFIDLEGKAEQYMKLMEKTTQNNSGSGGCTLQENRNSSSSSSSKSKNTINGKSSVNAKNKNTEESEESKDNNYDGSQEEQSLSYSSLYQKDVNEEYDEDASDNESMYNDLRKEWLSRPFVCPFCKQFSLNALQSQHDKDNFGKNSKEENVMRDEDVSELSAIESKSSTKLTHSVILEHVKRFRLLDGILDHFDDVHYDAWNHGSRELNESIMQSLYEVEQHKQNAVEAQIAEYKIAKREECRKKRTKETIVKNNNDHELEHETIEELQECIEEVESNNENNKDIATENVECTSNSSSKAKEEIEEQEQEMQNSLQNTFVNKTENRNTVETNNTTSESFTNTKISSNNNSTTNTLTSRSNNKPISRSNTNNTNNKSDGSNGMNVLTKDEIDVHARVGVNTTLIGIVKDIQAGFIDNERVLQYVIAVATPSANSEMVHSSNKKQEEKQKKWMINTSSQNKEANESNSQESEQDDEDEENEEEDEDLDEEELIVVRCVGSRLPIALLMANIHLNSWVYVSGLLKCNRHLDSKSRRIHAYPFVQVNPPLGTIRALYEHEQ